MIREITSHTERVLICRMADLKRQLPREGGLKGRTGDRKGHG